MPPLTHALRLHPASHTGLFSGDVDKDWVIGSVANGGYALALIIQACIQFQSSTPHADPIHVSAHFLRPVLLGPFTIQVRSVKSGSGFTNLTAEIIQRETVAIMSHAIFAVNGPHPKDKFGLTLKPPSPWARRHPLYTHPSEALVKPSRPQWHFRDHIKWSDDPHILAKNHPDHPNRTNNATVGGGDLEWGGWFEFTDKDERITSASLGFLTDILVNSAFLLPKSERKVSGMMWHPTMTLNIEFKAKIPPPSARHAARTVGLYSSGRFIEHPQGRHDAYVEVWTAPSNIGEGDPNADWRADQVCLATATQMALMLPMEVNQRKGNQHQSSEKPKL